MQCYRRGVTSLTTGCLLWLAILIAHHFVVMSHGSPVMSPAVAQHEKNTADIEAPYDDKDEPSVQKRAWNKLQGGWGKRGWQNLQSGWGKRVPYADTDRWLQDVDKRGWQNLQSGWGKRSPIDRQWDNDDLDSLYASAHDITGDYYEPGVLRSAAAIGDNDYFDEEKRTWRNLNAAWGKRDNNWSKFRGSWGKREPAWNNLKGLWG